jgi:hypothetical protein
MIKYSPLGEGGLKPLFTMPLTHVSGEPHAPIV